MGVRFDLVELGRLNRENPLPAFRFSNTMTLTHERLSTHKVSVLSKSVYGENNDASLVARDCSEREKLGRLALGLAGLPVITHRSPPLKDFPFLVRCHSLYSSVKQSSSVPLLICLIAESPIYLLQGLRDSKDSSQCRIQMYLRAISQSMP